MLNPIDFHLGSAKPVQRDSRLKQVAREVHVVLDEEPVPAQLGEHLQQLGPEDREVSDGHPSWRGLPACHSWTNVKSEKAIMYTELAKKVCPTRLRDSASDWEGGEFTQPRTHFFGAK